MPAAPVDEAELVRAVLEGDEAAFRVLYDAHGTTLYRFALRLTGGREADAEELTQETWVRAVRGLARFEGRSRFRTWLHSIASRCASDLYRGRTEANAKAALPDAVAAEPSTAQRIDLERAFAALPFGFRSVLVLHDIEGLPHREIAEQMGISVGTSKSQLSRARARMRALLGEAYV